MSPGKTLKISMTALTRNLTRSILTVSGIVIGIAAVIAMMEIGKGSQNAIQRSIASMGANNLLILPGTAATGGISFGAGSTLTLTSEDCDAILKDCPALANASPIVRIRGQVIFQDRNWVPSTLMGVTPAYLDVRQWADFDEGECFTDTDVRNASRVCIVGKTIVRELFGGQSPIGKELRIQNNAFKVLGVLSAKGANSFGQDQDDIILTPWTTAKFRIGGTGASAVSSNQAAVQSSATYPGGGSVFPAASGNSFDQLATKARFANVDQILASATDAGSIRPAMAQITAVLHERHHIRDGEPDDFNLRDMTEGANMLSSTTSMMTNLLLAVATISLAVGGVGIMNIMLVSVTERTREIGLRLAVGARANDVLLQFLTEAVVLCTLGGALGFAMGRGVSMIVRSLLRWPVEASLTAAIIAFTVSASIGIVFGFYPAWKAARLDPIEALRYE